VLDVYYTGPFDGHFIADTIMVVEVTLTLGHTVIYGSDMQDICVIGWGLSLGGNHAALPSPFPNPNLPNWFNWLDGWGITKPDGTVHYIWADPLGAYPGCEDFALVQKQALGITPATGQDPLSTV
jgi:hypothetical protein